MKAEQRKELIDSLGVTYEATFIPFAESRSAAALTGKPYRTDKGDLIIEKVPATKMSLNWKIRIERAGTSIETEYTQGCAHALSYKQGPMTREVDKRVRSECMYGYYPLTSLGFAKKRTPPPKLEDVLYCLLSDGDAIDYPTYEEWADNLGYDKDSRKGEAIYRQCVEIGLRLRRMFGDINLAKLREAFQDF